MATIRRPFDPESIYALDGDGNIRVTKGDAYGVFTTEGVHVEGGIRQADPQLCVWVGNNPEDPEAGAKGIAKATMIARVD